MAERGWGAGVKVEMFYRGLVFIYLVFYSIIVSAPHSFRAIKAKIKNIEPNGSNIRLIT